MQSKEKKEKLVQELLEIFQELNWDVILLMDGEQNVPGLVAGTSDFIDASRSSLENSDVTSIIAESDDAVEQLSNISDSSDSSSKKKTFH